MSSSFSDGHGREWKLRLNYGVCRDVKRETGVNLTIAAEAKDWTELLFGNPERIVGVLWVLCEPQAKEFGVSAEEFGYLFDGTTLEAAGVALANAIADFFPRSKVGIAIRKGLTQALEEADRRAVEAIEKGLATALPYASNARASSESTPPG